MSSLGTFLILAAFVLASGAFAASIAGARRQRPSLIEGGTGLFHTVTAMLLVASAVLVHAFVIGDFRIKYVQNTSNAEQPLFYKLASYWGGLDGSLLFWATLLAVFGSVAVLRESRAAPAADAVGRRVHLRRPDVLPVPARHSQQSVRDISDGGARGGRRPQSAAPELLHGHPSAVAVSRLRRDDHPVRVRHRRARERPARRLVAARRAHLDDDGLAAAHGRARARRALGVRRARAGAATGSGTRSRTPACCRGSRRRRSCIP